MQYCMNAIAEMLWPLPHAAQYRPMTFHQKAPTPPQIVRLMTANMAPTLKISCTQLPGVTDSQHGHILRMVAIGTCLQ